MRHSLQRDFTAYEFKEDDEAVERASERFTSRVSQRGNPKAEEPAVTKYTFLGVFAENKFNQNKVVDEDMAGESQRNFPTVEQSCVMDKISVSSTSFNMRDLASHGTVEAQGLIHERVKEDPTRMEVASPVTPDSGDEQSNCSLSDKRSKGMQLSISSEDLDSSASSPDHSDNEGSLEYPASADYWTGFREAEDTDIPVIVLAEYVIYGSELYAESRLIFFSDCIKIQCSDASGKEFISEWGIADIVHINCQWSQTVGSAWVKVWLKPSGGSPRLADVCKASVVVRFCVPDFQWLDKVQKIMLLAPRYKDIWSTVSDGKLVEEEDESLGPKPYISKHYLMDFKESCEEVIFPKGDPDAVSISKRDVDLLQPDTFINDTIIDFYIKYLIKRIQPKEKHRYHFFNSFFFRKLVDLDKDPSSAAEGRAAFLRVRKWTRKVNIFEKDYLFIPVNFNLHWSLLVICHPGEVAHFRAESIYVAHRVPCILHMDSMKGSHSGLKNLVQSYLWEEWIERHQESPSLSNFSNLRFIPLELPQQQNSFDCGLFLLHYVELFLKEVPVDFSPFTITKFSNFLNMDWFIPDEASHKRFVIRDLMCDLLNDSEKDPPASYSNWDCSEPTEKTVAKELAEFPASTSNPVKADLDNSACSIAHDVIDNKLSTLSSPDCARYDKEAGYFLHHFFEANATRKATFDSAGHILQQSNSFRKITSTMSPIEEEEEADGQFSLSPQESSQPLTGSLKTRMTPTSYGSEDGVLDTCQKLDNLMQVEHHDEGDSSPDVTSCGSLNSLEHNTTNMDKKDKSLPHETIDDVLHDGVNKENQRSSPENCGQDPDCPSSVSGEVLDTCVVEDSQEADNTTSESADCGVSSTCCWETADSCQAMGPISNRDPLDEENRQPGGEKLNSILGTQRHKRQRITHE